MELLSHVCGTQPYISSRALQHIIINQACDKVTLLLFKTSPLSLSSFHSLPSSDRRGQASNSPRYLLLTTQNQGLDFLQLAWRGCLTCSKYLPLQSVTECEQHLPNIHFSSKVNMQSNKVARLKLFFCILIHFLCTCAIHVPVAHVWRSEDILYEMVLSFHYVSPGG